MARLKRVLHVDDDEDIRLITRLSLEVMGDLELHQCASGQEAIAQAAGVRPDLFLLDYMMPGLNGEETLAGLRGLPGLAEVPVIFMTARVLDDIASPLLRDGALAVLTKPFEPMALHDDIQAAWRRRGERPAPEAARGEPR